MLICIYKKKTLSLKINLYFQKLLLSIQNYLNKLDVYYIFYVHSLLHQYSTLSLSNIWKRSKTGIYLSKWHSTRMSIIDIPILTWNHDIEKHPCHIMLNTQEKIKRIIINVAWNFRIVWTSHEEYRH